jgi:O-antigen/teichoic acid export membrane protein
MNLSSRLLQGAGAHYAGQAIVLLLGLFVTPLLLTYLGAADYGLWLVGQQLLTYIGLVDLGVVALVPREVGALRGRLGGVSSDQVRVLLGKTAHLTLAQVPVAGLAATMVWYGIPDGWAALKEPLGWILVGFVALSPLRLFQAALQGMQDLAFVSAVQTLGWVASTAVSVWLLLNGMGLMSLAWGWLVGQAVPPLVFWLRLRVRYPDILFPWLTPFVPGEALRQAGAGLWVTLNQVGLTFFSATDVFLIGFLLGPAVVVPYSLTSRLIVILANQGQAAVQLAIPGLAEIGAARDPGRARSAIMSLTFSLLLVSGLIACGLLAVNAIFVDWWVGPNHFAGPLLNGLLLLVMLMRHWNLAVVLSLFALGHNRRIPLTGLADGLVTLGSSWVLIGTLGMVGAPLGALLGVCLVSLPLNLFALARTLGLGVGRTVAPLANWATRFVILAGGAAMLGWTLPPGNLRDPATLGCLMTVGLAVTVIYVVVMRPVWSVTPLARHAGRSWAKLSAWMGRRPSAPPP